MAINIGDILTQRAMFSENKEAIKHHDKSISYRQLNNEANSFAQHLKNLGFVKGDKIATLCKNNEDIARCFLGAAKIGVITVVLNYRLHVNEMKYIVEHSDAKLIIFEDEFAFLVEDLMEIKQLQYKVSATTAPSMDDILFIAAKEPVLESFDDEPIVLLYTSGTTGLPKGTLISHNNLLATSISLTYTAGWRITDRFLAVSPFFHIAGLIAIVVATHIGCTLIMMRNFEPYEFWEIVEKEKITTAMVVPTMLEALMRVFDEVQPNTERIINFTSGASVVPPTLIEICNKNGIKIQQVYGITEYSGPISFWIPDQHPGKSHSSGKPVMHCKLQIRDSETDEEVANGQIGEIVVSGPQVFVGYYKNQEAYDEVVKDGLYYTGDVGYKDAEDFLYVIDRKKDMIISGGENIYSAEIELLLAKHPKIAEVAVIAKPEEKWGEIPYAILVLNKGEEITLEEVVQYCKENLAAYKAIKGIEIVEGLPRNAVGKILKHQLREQVFVKE